MDALDAPEPPQGEFWSDEPPMETYQHMMAQLVLITSLQWHWRGRTDYFCAGNLTVFYSPNQKKSKDFAGPDFFVALDVDGTRPRRSWVVWQEDGKYPNVIVELLSDSTAKNDRGEKKRVYQDIFRTPEYFLFDPHSFDFEGYCLVAGRYEPIPPDAAGRLRCEQLDLSLGVHGGELRFFTPDGLLVAKPSEAAELAEQRADAAEARVAALEKQLRGK